MDHVTIAPSVLYFGTPVVLLSTENADGTTNLAPMSSAWALGNSFVLGLGAAGHTVANLAARPDLVINFPGPKQWAAVERLGLLTGANPVPAAKADRWRHEPDKFAAAGLHPCPSELVRPPRVAECPVQLEAHAAHVGLDADANFVIVQARVLRVHADKNIVIDASSHVDTDRWSPLIYNFRHYFGLGDRLGKSARAEY